MRIAFMFPGQGSQFVGMGKEIYEKYPEVRNLYEKASKLLNVDMKKLCFESSNEELTKTSNAQIAIAVNSLAILEVLKHNGIEADISVGLSLGEYVALMYSKYISIEDGLRLLKDRGYCMENLVPNEEYSMAAVMGLDSKKIEEICTNIRNQNKFVMPANYNYLSQTVISGNADAIDIAIEKLKEAGAKRVIKLNTSGPFHTEKLQNASNEYRKSLENVEFNYTDKKVIKNLDGTFYKEDDNFVDVLSKHIISPVRFDKAIQTLKENNVDCFIEIGPGKAMSGFIKKELKDSDIVCLQTENLEQLNKTINYFKFSD